MLTRSLEMAFPGAALAGRITSPSPALADAIQILGSAPDFELGRVRVADYAERYPEAFSGIANQAMTIAQLQAMERLHKLTPSVSEIKAMMDLGFDSAQSIVRLGNARFQELLAGALGEGRAATIYSVARKVSASSHALAARYHAAFHTLSAYVLPKAAAPAEGQVASWPALFGALDFCACGHCRSVYSPAAYLVDLLQFLRRYSAQLQVVVPWWKFNIFTQQSIQWSFSQPSAHDVLLARRPDIASIELTCENTNTPVPYVDLVNEILEYAVANTELSPAVTFPDHIATEGTPEELAAQPQPPAPSKQIVVDTAHDILATRPYPWRLPFNIGQEEARVYLDHLGAPRARWMGVLRPASGAEPPDFPVRLALERLRLSEVDRQLLTGTPAGGLWQAWGLSENNGSIADPTGVSQSPIQGSWIEVLQHVAVLLARAGISYEELMELLATDFVNPSPQALAVEAAPGADPLTCKLSELRIPALDAAALDRIHRFTRLRRALGWTSAELDQAIRILGGQIDEP
ncbi:MAG TPA: hypothetical protein VLS89_11960, partial [Candidatus Nanopelagicales bacterium]|nr:hypothetical protein [Candidatus Nanopelagicales bacterium]